MNKTRYEIIMIDGYAARVQVIGNDPLSKAERDEIRYAVRLCLYSHLADWN